MRASKIDMTKAPLFALGFVVALVSGLAACPRPTDPTPPIAVSPGAAARAERLSRGRRTVVDAGAAGRARAHPMERGRELGGPNATGRAGDWLLENDEVAFVIDALGRGEGFAESGGNLIDAADARVRKDELGQIMTYFGVFPRQAVYTTIDAREEADGTAVVIARGKELYDPDLDVMTEYRLAPGDRALLLVTTLTNTGTKPASGLGLGDAIQWGGAEKFAPGKAVGFKGKSSGAFIGAIGRFTSYGITSTDGAIVAISGGAWTDTEQKTNVTLAPKSAVTYERVLVVGERADAASVVSELTRAAGGEVGAIDITLVDSSGRPVQAAQGAKVILGTAAEPAILSMVATGDTARIVGEVPKGKWRVGYAPSAGRRGDGKVLDIEVRERSVARGTLAVTEPSSTKIGPCTEDGRPVPCKLTIESAASTPLPDLGPAHVAGPAKNQMTLLAGESFTVPLPHGSYKITASRGPEYELSVQEIVVPRDSEAVPFVLRRVVATPGYVAADFHQHTTLSGDAPVALRDRVIANAAEGVEIAVATEHNVVADFTPIARELGLSSLFVSIPGDELSTDASKKPWGHANVFPLPVRSDRPRGGAIAVRDRTPKDVFAEARALTGGPRVVAVNHPRSGSNGYFDLLGFDSSRGSGADPDYDGGFDALEVWNGRNVEMRARVIEDWSALVRNSHPVTPIAATDTHGIVGQEAGYPRTYVRVSDDAHLDRWDETRTADFVRGVRDTRDVVLTNGPFMTVTLGGVGIGGIAAGKGRPVELKVQVVTASWNTVDTIEIHELTAPATKAPATRRSSRLVPAFRKDGAFIAESTTSVQGTRDAAVVVVVRGTKPMRPVLDGDDAAITPWAMSAPIWIDGDGDGKSLGR